MGRLSCFGPAARSHAMRRRSGSVPSPKGAGTRQSPGCAIPRTDEASGDRYPWPPYAPTRTAARGWELTRPSMRCGPLAFGGGSRKNMQNREDIRFRRGQYPCRRQAPPAAATARCRSWPRRSSDTSLRSKLHATGLGKPVQLPAASQVANQRQFGFGQAELLLKQAQVQPLARAGPTTAPAGVAAQTRRTGTSRSGPRPPPACPPDRA